jgi:DNA-binding winged helix-turn-helix (wHTH) protein/TolB-like protein/Tfp pilus assembly protein PilF
VIPRQTSTVYEFGPFRLDTAERLLLRDGRPVEVTPKAFDTLLVLVENGGRMLAKEELLRAVWPDAFVEENYLSVNISKLRAALGEGPRDRQYIETVPRRGYRFVAGVREVRDATAPGRELVLSRRTLSRIVIEDEETPPAGEAAAGAARGVGQPAGALAARGGRRVGWVAAAVAAALACGAVAAAVLVQRGPLPRAAKMAPTSVAVLPIQPLGGSGGDEHLRLGVTDALITRLSGVGAVRVRPTSSVLRFDSPGRDPVAAGRALGVDAVLDGRMQRTGDRLRLTVQLLSVGDGSPLWAESFNADLTDIFELQDGISARVAAALAPELSAEERRPAAKDYTADTRAYEAYLRGRFFWNKRGMKWVEQAEGYFRQAVEIDPAYAPAYAGLAEVLSIRKIPSPEAERAARRAIELDDGLAEAHAALGFIKLFHHWDWGASERALRRALELKPGYAAAHQWYALLLAARGRLDEAEARMRHALAIDPLSVGVNTDLGQILYYKRDYDGAERQCRKALDLDPNYLFAHYYLYLIYTQKGMHAEAVEEHIKGILTSFPNHSPDWDKRLREAFAARGIEGFLRALAAEYEDRETPYRYGAAEAYALLGERDRALEWLGRALAEPDFFNAAFVRVEPAFDPLRPDPRFAETLRRAGLAE